MASASGGTRRPRGCRGGRPVRRRLLAEIERAGGWAAVLARIAGGEPVAGIARSFGASRGFFARVLHEDRDRHAFVIEARRQAATN